MIKLGIIAVQFQCISMTNPVTCLLIMYIFPAHLARPPEVPQDVILTLQQLLVPQDTTPVPYPAPISRRPDVPRPWPQSRWKTQLTLDTFHIGPEERHTFHWNPRPQVLCVPWEYGAGHQAVMDARPPQHPLPPAQEPVCFSSGETSRELETDLGKGPRLLSNTSNCTHVSVQYCSNYFRYKTLFLARSEQPLYSIQSGSS